MINKFLYSCIFLSVIACKGKKEETKVSGGGSSKNQPATVDVLIAGKQTINNQLEVNGSVVPYEQVVLQTEVNGRVTYLNLPEGNIVQKGTILVKLNDADLQAQLQKVKAQLQLAEITENRLKKLLQVNGINQADYDNALNQVNSLKADEAFLKAQIEKTVLKAPFTGIVGLRNISIGAYVTTATPLATIQETGRVKIDFSVPEQYVAYTQKGQTVKVETTKKNQSFNATIMAFEPQIDATTRNLKLRATTNANIAAGAFVKVLVPVKNNESAIMVPSSCIIPDARSKQIIVVKNGESQFVKVQTGLRTASQVEVTEGLSVGDSVVVTGVLFVRPNQQVKVRGTKQLSDFAN